MSDHQINYNHRFVSARRHKSIQRIYAALERECQQRQRDPRWLFLEEEKMRQTRLALFGSAPQ